MTKTEKLRRWRVAKQRRNLTCKQIAGLLDPAVAPQTVFNWNCGSQTIPEKRVLELEAMQ
jgi:hypothetical protein